MSADELAAYNRHWENVRYAKSMMRSAKLEGMIEGEQIGLEKGKILTVFFPLRAGKTIEDVAALTNPPVDLIEQARKLIYEYGDQAEDHLDELIR